MSTATKSIKWTNITVWTLCDHEVSIQIHSGIARFPCDSTAFLYYCRTCIIVGWLGWCVTVVLIWAVCVCCDCIIESYSRCRFYVDTMVLFSWINILVSHWYSHYLVTLVPANIPYRKLRSRRRFCTPLSVLACVWDYVSAISPVSIDGFSPKFCHWCILGQIWTD